MLPIIKISIGGEKRRIMSKLRIAVIFGGMSNEHEISLISASNIISSICEKKFEVICIGITKKGRWYYYPGSVDDIKNGEWEKSPDLVPCILSPDPIHKGLIKILSDGMSQLLKVDCVFPVLHGKNGEDGTIQGLLDLSGIPYVGCGVLSSSNCMDKEKTHIILESCGIKTAPYAVITSYELDQINEKASEFEKLFPYPMFVKPANCGSSVGVSKVTNRIELINGIKTAFAHDKKVLVETMIYGKECECAVLGNNKPMISTVAEIVSGGEFYDYEGKYKSNDSEFFIPARIDDKFIERVRQTAADAYKALECQGLSRVDFFVCSNGEIILNEINTMPGFTAISMYPQLMQKSGFSTSELVEKLIELAFERAEIAYE